MEEPPKVERIVSSRGVSIADAASLLKSFLSKIDQYDDNHHYERENDYDLFYNDGLFGQECRKDTVAAAATTTSNTTPQYETGKSPPRKSWEEREEEALISQMDKLANANNNSTMGISDDVLERLRMITKSICAEVDGKHLSASGMLMNAAVAASSTRENHGVAAATHYFNEGQQHETTNYFSVKTEEPIDESWEQQHPSQHPHIAEIEVGKTKKEKKKEKKAKKAAKKARKEAKRKAKDVNFN